MASNLIVARGAVEYLPPKSLAFWRWILAFIILFLFTHREILEKVKYFKKEFLNILFLGVTGAGICGAFPFIAGISTTVVNMGIIYSSSPIFIILFSYFIFNTQLTYMQIFGFFISFVGVIIIASKANLGVLINLNFNFGDIWILGASISWAIYSVYQIKLKSKFTVFARVTLISLLGAISLFPFIFVEKYFFYKATININAILWVIFAALSPSIIAFFLYANLQKRVGTNVAGLVVYLYPIYGSIYGFLIFSETLKLFHIIGGLLVFLGIFFCKDFKKKNA